MIFKYELRFLAFTWPVDLSLLFIVLVGRNVVSHIYKLKPKNLFFYYKPMFSSPATTEWYVKFRILGREMRKAKERVCRRTES